MWMRSAEKVILSFLLLAPTKPRSRANCEKAKPRYFWTAVTETLQNGGKRMKELFLIWKLRVIF